MKYKNNSSWSRPNLKMYDKTEPAFSNAKKFEKYTFSKEYAVNLIRNRMKVMTYKRLVFLLKKSHKTFNFLPWCIEELDKLTDAEYDKIIERLQYSLDCTIEKDGDRRLTIRNSLSNNIAVMLDKHYIYTTFGEKGYERNL